MSATPEQVAEKLGGEHGKNAASWFFDGNTQQETYERVLRGLDEGDPEVLDSLPQSPLSGEWGDSYSLADLARDTGVPQGSDGFDDVCRAYEDAFYMASQGEIERAARLHVS